MGFVLALNGTEGAADSEMKPQDLQVDVLVGFTFQETVNE